MVMKVSSSKRIGIFTLFAAVLLFCSWTYFDKPEPIRYAKPVATPITMCGSLSFDWADTAFSKARILPGLGDLHYPVTTASIKAQEFFEQGLRLIYAFNHWEAIQSFREAARLDPDCAMAYWGLALAYGPNLNDVNPKDRERIAFESIQKAIARKDKVSVVEKDFIDAMAARYNGKAYDNRDSLNQSYANAMTQLARKYPDDAEAQTLCADAIMNTMPWDYWNGDGSPKPPTSEAKLLLENVQKRFPKHPGAHHLYIHLVEASPDPAQAMPSAQFLENAMPGAGHIIHMPAHIYIRVGQYTRSIESNLRAVKVDEDYLANSENRGMYRIGYYPHNIDFISFSSYMEGRSGLGIQTALKLAYKGNMITKSNPVFAQYFGVEPMIAFTRFGKWNDILSLSDPDDNLLYSQVLWHFSRGMAFTRTNNTAMAAQELVKLDSLCQLDTLKSVYFSFNPVYNIVKVPLSILRGELLIKQKKTDEGLASLVNAVKAEDSLRYMEPPDWKIPSRHFLGAALLEAGKFAEAEQVYLEDLKRNAENGWSLTGLQQCQAKLGKKTEMAATAKRFAKAWKNADIAITSSRY
jgi:tetratricopeptide (TPR) repeat protein